MRFRRTAEVRVLRQAAGAFFNCIILRLTFYVDLFLHSAVKIPWLCNFCHMFTSVKLFVSYICAFALLKL